MKTMFSGNKFVKYVGNYSITAGIIAVTTSVVF